MDKGVFYFKGRDILLDGRGLPPARHEAWDAVAVASHTDVATGVEAVELPRDFELGDTADGCRFVPLRHYFVTAPPCEDLAEPLAVTAARMKGFVNWRMAVRFCPSCGAELELKADENARVCPSCGKVHYPRIEPCVIAVIERGEDILLLRHRLRNSDIWCCLAGFVEAGESLEHALIREVKEETGLQIKNIRYAGSQSWPFPDQLMVGFYAEYAGGELKLQEEEIMEARWFNRHDLPAHPSQGSISWNLIHYEKVKY